jgi:hypothetical protein
MNPSAPKTSPRLERAAIAEIEQLERERDTLSRSHEALRAQLEHIEIAIAAVEERLQLLARLTGPRPAPTCSDETDQPKDENGHTRTLLRGPSIRDTAVRILLDANRASRPIHYRRWYQDLQNAGFDVAGKDPLAVFLSQITRSPVVRRTSDAGTYVVAPDAIDDLRRRLAQLQRDLRELATTPVAAHAGAQRTQREQLINEIRRNEQALEEANRLLPDQITELRLAASG